MGNICSQKVLVMDFSLQRHKTILLGKHQFQDLSLVESFALFKSYGCMCVCVCVVNYLPQGLHQSPSGGEFEGRIGKTSSTSVLLQTAAGEAGRLTSLSYRRFLLFLTFL